MSDYYPHTVESVASETGRETRDVLTAIEYIGRDNRPDLWESGAFPDCPISDIGRMQILEYFDSLREPEPIAYPHTVESVASETGHETRDVWAALDYIGARNYRPDLWDGESQTISDIGYELIKEYFASL